MQLSYQQRCLIDSKNNYVLESCSDMIKGCSGMINLK
jgi:hypothetical protein